MELFRLLWAASCLFLLSGCSDEPEAAEKATKSAQSKSKTRVGNAKAVENSVRPPRNYLFKEEQAYGYVTGVSENDRKNGKAVGDIMMFRYLGSAGGIHKLSLAGSEAGDFPVRYECSNPCVAIEMYVAGQASRIAFSKNTVLGSAFEDAFAGYLKPSRPVPETKSKSVAQTPDGASSWLGSYQGTLGGDASGSLNISRKRGQLWAELTMASANCIGELSGPARESNGAKIVQEASEFGACTVTLVKTPQGVRTVEGQCNTHGASCYFDGIMSKVG